MLSLLKKGGGGPIVTILTALSVYRMYGGQFPAPALLLLFSAATISFGAHSRRLVKFNWIDYLALLLILILLVGLIYSDHLSYGVKKFSTALSFFICFFVIRNDLAKNIGLFCTSILFFFVIYAAELYFQHGSLGQIALEIGNNFRLGWDDEQESFQAGPIAISRFSCLALFVLFYLSSTRNSRDTQLPKLIFLFLLLSAPMAAILIFLSGTKAPILALLVSLVLLQFHLVNSSRTRLHLKVGILFPVVLLFSGYFISGLYLSHENLAAFVANRFFDFSSALDDRQFQISRAVFNLDQVNIFLGAGTGDFGVVTTDALVRDYPHNILAEVMFENGIIAAILLSTIIVSTFNFATSRLKIEIRFFAALNLYFLLNSLFSGDILANAIVFGLPLLMNKRLYYRNATDILPK